MNKKIRHEFKADREQIKVGTESKGTDLKRIADALESIASSLKDLTQNNMLGY